MKSDCVHILSFMSHKSNLPVGVTGEYIILID